MMQETIRKQICLLFRRRIHYINRTNRQWVGQTGTYEQMHISPNVQSTPFTPGIYAQWGHEPSQDVIGWQSFNSLGLGKHPSSQVKWPHVGLLEWSGDFYENKTTSKNEPRNICFCLWHWVVEHVYLELQSGDCVTSGFVWACKLLCLSMRNIIFDTWTHGNIKMQIHTLHRHD